MGNQVNVPQLFNSQYATENLLYRIAYAFTAGDMLTLVLDENGSVVWGWGEKDFRNSPDQKSVLHLVRILNHCRKRWKEFLHYGKMVHPMEVTGVGFTELPMQCGYIQKVDNVHSSVDKVFKRRILGKSFHKIRWITVDNCNSFHCEFVDNFI